MPDRLTPRRWLPETGTLFGGPARILRPSRYAVAGRVATAKAQASQEAESTLEHDLLQLLEFDRRVETYASQPITLRWRDSQGAHRYTPDVAVRYRPAAQRQDPRLRTTVIEVKPRVVLQRDWTTLRPKFRAAIAWCRDRDMAFRILTEQEIRTPYLDNVRFLLRFRGREVDEGIAPEDVRPKRLREALATLRTSTPRVLLQAVASNEQEQADYLPWLWRLVDRGSIGCDLHERLTMTSPLWMPETSLNPGTEARP